MFKPGDFHLNIPVIRKAVASLQGETQGLAIQINPLERIELGNIMTGDTAVQGQRHGFRSLGKGRSL